MLTLVNIITGTPKEFGAWPYVSALHNVYWYYGLAGRSEETDSRVITDGLTSLTSPQTT